MKLFQGQTRQRIRARQTEGEVQVDFTGGLRLVEDGQRIEPNQLRELTSMDPLSTGGVERRAGLMPFASLAGTVTSEVIEYVTATGTELYCEAAGLIYRILPGDQVVATGWAIPGAGNFTGAQVGKYLYVGRDDGASDWQRWDGTTLTAVASAVRLDAEDHNGTGLPDFGSFTQPGIPQGDRLVQWDGRLWVTQPRISGDQNKAGIAFSFSFGVGDRQGQEDFYEDWVYNFDGTEGDEVLAIEATGNSMYVLLRNSIHSLTPYLGERATLFYNAQAFQSRVGCVGPKASTSSGDALWFYDRKEGLMRIGADGTLSGHMAQIERLKDRLAPDLSTIAVGYSDGKVYVSVPEKLTGANPTQNTRTYVYHVALDAWSMYDLGLDDFFSYRPSAAAQPSAALLARVNVPVAALVTLDGDNDHSHDHYNDVVSAEIIGSFKTAWFDSEVPEAVKDWRRCEVTYRAKAGQTIQQTAVIDWDPYRIGGRWTQVVSNSASWDDGKQAPVSWTTIGTGIYEPLYATMSPPTYPSYQENNVNDATLKDRSARRDEISGPPVGTATKLSRPVSVSRVCSSRSVSLEFAEPTSSGRWGVDRITLFYSRKPIGA